MSECRSQYSIKEFSQVFVFFNPQIFSFADQHSVFTCIVDETVTKAALKETHWFPVLMQGNDAVTVASLTRNILNNVCC